MSEKALSLVIPVHNEEGALPRLFQALEQLQEDLPQLRTIIFVDDGSNDRSFPLLLEANTSHEGWRVLRFSRNFGQQVAILAGLRHTDTDAVVLMDADLQDPPQVIPEMVKKWEQGWDVVYGVRRSRDGESWIKRLSAKVFYRVLSQLSDIDIPIDAGDFRIMDRKVVRVINQLHEQRPYVRGLVSWAGFRQASVEFDRSPRQEGQTNYDLRKMMQLSVDAIIGFSSTPLRVITRLGLLVVLLSLIYSAIVLGLWLNDVNVPGWTSMMLVILFLGSIQLISLGVLGEYLAILTTEAKDRPRFIITFDSNRTENPEDRSGNDD